jgi:hypothetical protein
MSGGRSGQAGGAQPQPLGPPGGGGGGAPGAISLAVPPAARGVLANNDSVMTDGLSGLVTVEYRILVPVHQESVLLRGPAGGVRCMAACHTSRSM